MRRCWKSALAGAMAIAMTLSPIGGIETAMAATVTEATNMEEATTGATTTEEHTPETTLTEAATETTTEDSGEDAADAFDYDDSGVISILPEETDTEEATAEEEKSTGGETAAEEVGADMLGDIPLTAKYFPDEVFRNYIAKKCDDNKDGVLSKQEREIQVICPPFSDNSKDKIKSLEGIQYFPELVGITCPENEITSIDTSKNPKLKSLVCYDNPLKSLNVSKNPKLTNLELSGAKLQKLDLSNNKELVNLICFGSQLQSLNLSNNKELVKLYCSESQLQSLDLSNNTKLKELVCGSTEIKNLNLKQNRELVKVWCIGKKLENIDVSNCIKLQELACGDKIQNLDVSHNSALVKLSCQGNLTKLDISKNPNLKELSCGNNQLKQLDVSKNINLEILNCSRNQLQALNISQNTNLKKLWCGENQIKELNIRENTNLVELNSDRNQLTKLDISSNGQMTSLSCSWNQLTNLNLKNNTALASLCCGWNKLRRLDVSQNKELVSIYCGGNELAYIDISQNSKLNSLIAASNVYTVKLATESKGRLDLTTISGLQISKIKNLAGGTIKGNILTFNNGVDKVTYNYDCGNGYSVLFTIQNLNAMTKTEAFCNRLYTLCLGRKADPAGIKYWAAQLDNKAQSGAQVGYQFVFSEEYKNKNTSNEEYVKMLYQVFMNRQADKGGLNYWVGLLNDGMSREYVYKGFAESTEFTNICNSYGINRGTVTIRQARDRNVNLTRFVNRIYVKAMNRKGEEAGLNYWCEQIQYKRMTPTQVAESFIYSKEFTDKKLSNTEYVKVLYRTFMGREADQSGLNYWVGRLNHGESRKTILKSFAGCPEFKNIVKSFGL